MRVREKKREEKKEMKKGKVKREVAVKKKRRKKDGESCNKYDNVRWQINNTKKDVLEEEQRMGKCTKKEGGERKNRKREREREINRKREREKREKRG